MKTIRIKDRNIGQGYPAYVIAEMSANHAGSKTRAKEIIHAAKESGADCIKIQTYTADTITIDCNKPWFTVKNAAWEGENLYHLYSRAYTPWEWQQELKEEADKVGIDFLSTPFDPTAVDFLEGIGLEFYKIASFEIVDIPLIKHVAATGKPIIMSTGMATKGEIQEALEAIYSQNNEQVALLKCSSAYPAVISQMNLRTIADMKETFQVPVGLSDHSLGAFSASIAVAQGASVIEKHFCISKEVDNPDVSFSMDPAEFSKMVRDIREVESALGMVQYGVTEQEKTSYGSRKSVFVVQDIKKGETFTRENIRVIRPGYGLKPKYFEQILGKTAICDVERGTPLSFEMTDWRPEEL